jgi:hypothetical protein
MGTRTPNMSIYVPTNGEDLYGTSFKAGLMNIDAHDHSGAPDNGVQIGTNGIQDGAITPDKLSNQIIVEDTVSTTNATPTQIASIPVPESSSVTITGRFIGLRDTATEAVGGTFRGEFHRPTGGSVAVIGIVQVDLDEDSSGSPTIDLIADTGTESASIQVTGEVGKNFNWKVAYNVLSLP